MRRHGGVFLALTSGAAEICWIYPWSSLTLNLIIGHSISLPALAAVFVFSVILASLSQGRGWRVVNLALIQVLGFAGASTLILHSFYYPSYPRLGTAWIIPLFTASRTPMEWFHLVLVLLWVCLFWIAGVAYAKRERSYTKICTRFDIGLAAFFVLFLTRLALRIKGGINTDDNLSPALVYPYLLLALTAIGMARVGLGEPTYFLPGYGGVGIFMSILSIVLLSGSSLILVFIPYLAQMAEAGQHVLKGVALWALPVVTGVIRFMFMGGKVKPDPPSGSSPPGSGVTGVTVITDWWTEVLEKIFRWGLEATMVAFAAFFAVVLVYLVLRWLFSRTAINLSKRSRHDSLSWITRLRTLLLALQQALKNVTRGYSRATELYSILSEWGRHSGVPRLATNTPHEFGARLAGQFPRLKAEIDSIIHAFTLEVYGRAGITREQFSNALMAWHTVRSPVHWPQRFKVRFISRMLSEP